MEFDPAAYRRLLLEIQRKHPKTLSDDEIETVLRTDADGTRLERALDSITDKQRTTLVSVLGLITGIPVRQTHLVGKTAPSRQRVSQLYYTALQRLSERL